MIKTTYTCDFCKKEQHTANQFWSARVGIRHYESPTVHEERRADICRDCLESFHLLPATKERTTPPPTTEDLFREILARCSGED